MREEEMTPCFVQCDWCGAWGNVLDEMLIVVMRLQDGSLEPEAWCLACQREAHYAQQ